MCLAGAHLSASSHRGLNGICLLVLPVKNICKCIWRSHIGSDHLLWINLQDPVVMYISQPTYNTQPHLGLTLFWSVMMKSTCSLGSLGINV